jgi:hypothetical protein
MIIKEAHISDNDDLIALARATPMDGLISLRIDREPDYFSLLSLRGQGKVFVASINGSIAGSISVAYRKVYISGKPTLIGYIGDLRVLPHYSGSRVTYHLLKALLDYAHSLDVDIYFCVTARGNKRIRSLLEGRMGFPKFHSIGKFYVYQLLPLPFFKKLEKPIIRRAVPADFDILFGLLDSFNSNFEFGPCWSIDEFKKEADFFSQNRSMEFFVSYEDEKLVASISTFDTSSVKRNVVIGMPLYLRVMLAGLNTVRSIVPLPVFPKTGDPINILYLRHLCCIQDEIRPLRSLIRYICSIVPKEKYSFIAVGFHERDPFRKSVSVFPKFTFISEGYVTCLSENEKKINQIRKNIPLEDFSLV